MQEGRGESNLIKSLTSSEYSGGGNHTTIKGATSCHISSYRESYGVVVFYKKGLYGAIGSSKGL